MAKLDPRRALDELIKERGESYSSVSRLLSRNPAYIQQFIKRGSPNRITFTFRATLNGRRLSIAVPIGPEPTGSMRLPLLRLARFLPIAAVSALHFARTVYSAPSSIGWLSMAD